MKSIKRILLYFLLLLIIWYSSNISAYILPKDTAESYITVLNNNLVEFWKHQDLLESYITKIDTAGTENDVSVLWVPFTTLYNSLVWTRDEKKLILVNQLNQVNIVLTDLDEKYANNIINKEDYWTIKNTLDIISTKIKREIINLWSLESYNTIYQSLMNSISLKLWSLLIYETDLEWKITNYNSSIDSFTTSLNSFKTTYDSSTLESLSNLSSTIWTSTNENSVYLLLVNSTFSEITALKNELNLMITDLENYQSKLTTLWTLDFDLDNELSIVNTIVTEKVAQKDLEDNLLTTLESTYTWIEKTWLDKVMTEILVNWLISNTSDLSADASTTDLLLQKVDFKVPFVWFLYNSDDLITSQSNQTYFKWVYTNLVSNEINEWWVEIPANLENSKVNYFKQSLPIKKVQDFEETFWFNINKEQVIWLNIEYNSNWTNKTYDLKSKIDLEKQKLYDTDWNEITTTWLLDLNWINLKEWQYYINLRLWLDKKDFDSNLSDITTLRKKLYISIVNENLKNIYSWVISWVDENVSDLTSITLKNLWKIAFNTTDTANITINYSWFQNDDIYTMYLNDLKLRFIWYADNTYKELQSIIRTNYKYNNLNKITDDFWNIIWYKKTKVNVSINQEQNSKVVTYKKLDNIDWDSMTQNFDLINSTYVSEQNVIIDPIIKSYFRTDITPSFNKKFNEIRDVLTIWNKIQKISRLKDSSWNDIITEYRYFASGDNNDTTLGDTTWKVLIFFRIKEIKVEWDKTRWIDRVENVYYKVWLDDNYSKVINTNNSFSTISTWWDISDLVKPSIVTVNPIMTYKTFTYYKLYFNKDNFLAWDLRNSIRYTKIYEKDMYRYDTVKYNWSVIGAKWSWLIFQDTIRN